MSFGKPFPVDAFQTVTWSKVHPIFFCSLLSSVLSTDGVVCVNLLLFHPCFFLPIAVVGIVDRWCGVFFCPFSFFTRVLLLVPTQIVQRTHHFLLWKNNLRVTCVGAAVRHNRHWWNFIMFPSGENVKKKNVVALSFNLKEKCTTKRVLLSWPWRRRACAEIVLNLGLRTAGSVSRCANRKLGCIVVIYHPRIHHRVVHVSKVRQTKSPNPIVFKLFVHINTFSTTPFLKHNTGSFPTVCPGQWTRARPFRTPKYLSWVVVWHQPSTLWHAPTMLKIHNLGQLSRDLLFLAGAWICVALPNSLFHEPKVNRVTWRRSLKRHPMDAWKRVLRCVHHPTRTIWILPKVMAWTHNKKLLSLEKW